MNRPLRIYFCLALTLLAALACEKIIGIESKYQVVESDSGSVATTTCTAISSNGVGLRIANMIPVDQKVDVCVAAAGASFPQDPLFASSGSECPKGIGYGQYTVRLNVAVGTYQIKLVPYGSTCDVEGPTLSGVRVDTPTDTAHTSSTTVVAFGTDWSAAEAQLAALEDSDRTGGNIYIRFFHALADVGTLDAGLVDSNQTPPIMTTAVFHNVSFGATAAASPGALSVDDQGYMLYPTQSSGVGGLSLGATVDSTNSQVAFIDSFVTLTREHHYTLFLMGQSGSAQFPPKLWSCDETSNYGAFADCGEPLPITVGIFHPNLTDQFTDYIDVRQAAALDAIAQSDASTGSTANALCVPELYSPDTRASLKHRLGTTTVVFSDDYPISADSNLTDQSGIMPQYKDVVCDGPLQEQMQAFEACLLDPQLQTAGCITVATGEADAGDSKHYFAFRGKQAIGCAAEACQTQVANFVVAESFDADACFMCGIAHLSSGEAIEDMYTACTSPNQNRPHFVYGGSTGLAMVIKPPLVLATSDSPEVVALPASTWNRAALRVPVKLPDNNTVFDLWCASVRAPNSETFLPNGGPYHGNATAQVTDIEQANAAEENLQISRLIATVNQHVSSTQKRAIVAALTYTSPQLGDQVTGLHPENFALFNNPSWNELVAHSYVPACTFCGDNPLNSSQDNQWMEHLFGIGIDSDMVTDTQRTFTGNALNLVLYSTPDQPPTPVPLSQYYGLQSTARISQ